MPRIGPGAKKRKNQRIGERCGLARTLGKVLGRPALLPVPASVLRLLLGEQAEILLASQRALPQRLLEAGFSFRYPQLEAALRQVLAGD